MFETESDYFEALGLEAPTEDAAGAADEAAEPGAEAEEQDIAAEGAGENEREDAEPAGGDEMFPDEPPEDTDEGANEQEPAEPAGKPQSKEERAQNAQRRRQAELDAAVQRAVMQERARHDQEIRELFSKAGFTDGENAIESTDQLRDFLARQAAQKLEDELKRGTVSMESFQNAVRAEIARQQQPAPTAPQEPDQQAFFRQVAQEMREIQQYDPDIRTPKDFQKLDRAEAFFDAVRNHNFSFIDAYRYVYADKIADAKARQAAQQAAQRARNNDRSKAHMRQTGSAGSGSVTVPAQVERNIRVLMPKATGKEIREYYQKYQKETGG